MRKPHNISYVSLQKKYPGRIVAISEKEGKVIATARTSQALEMTLKHKRIDPSACLFLGPIERYNQISVYIFSLSIQGRQKRKTSRTRHLSSSHHPVRNSQNGFPG